MEQNPDGSTHQLAFEFAGNASDGLSLWREQQKAALRGFSPEMSRKRRAKVPKMRNCLVGAISFIAVGNFDAKGQAIAP
jgi:hypothetical protein